MTTTDIRAQYSTGLSRNNIEKTLIAAGYDLDHLQPADLGMLEDFHTMGRIATGQVLRGVTRVAIGVKSGTSVALLPLAEIGMPILPEFAAPKRWSF